MKGLRGGLMVCGTTSDAGKSFVVAGLCRLLARHGVRVAPFKAQNMANNAAVTVDGAEIGHAQWVQALAAGVEPTSLMNPVLLKPTGERTSQVVVHGRPLGEMTAASYQQVKADLRPVVLDALDQLRAGYDVVICEGAGSPAEINLLENDIVNLGLAEAAGLPAIVVGDIDRGGVFAALYGTVALLPDELRDRVRAFVVNKLRGDPQLLGGACEELERRCGVPTLGVVPQVPGPDIDGEDSLTLDNQRLGSDRSDSSPVPHLSDLSAADRPVGALSPLSDVLDVAAVRWPLVANASDLDPLRVDPTVRVRWVTSVAELGRPDLVVLPGSKATRSDLEWFWNTGLAEAVGASDAAVVAICAGLQMCGASIDDPAGVEGPPGSMDGLGWLGVRTTFAGDKILDRPEGWVVAGPGAGGRVAGYRIHHGRVSPSDDGRVKPAASGKVAPSADGRPTADGADIWIEDAAGQPLGWRSGRVCGTTLHSLFEDDGFRATLLTWVATRRGKRWAPSGVSFPTTRTARFDRIADALEEHLDMNRLADLISSAQGKPDEPPTMHTPRPIP